MASIARRQCIYAAGWHGPARCGWVSRSYDMWGDAIYVEYRRQASSKPRILEGDVVKFWDKFVGIKSYKAVLANPVQVPHAQTAPSGRVARGQPTARPPLAAAQAIAGAFAPTGLPQPRQDQLHVSIVEGAQPGPSTRPSNRRSPPARKGRRETMHDVDRHS